MFSLKVDASTAEVECKLDGNGPWKLADDLELIHTPGHSKVSKYVPLANLVIYCTMDLCYRWTDPASQLM